MNLRVKKSKGFKRESSREFKRESSKEPEREEIEEVESEEIERMKEEERGEATHRLENKNKRGTAYQRAC
jgi:hypothetical protein